MKLERKVYAGILAISLVLLHYGVTIAVDRDITDVSDNIVTFITNTNGLILPATGDNIQIAIDNLTSGTVTLPSGTFTISLQLYINDGIWLRGQGNSTVITGHYVSFRSGSNNNKLSDLKIYGSGRVNVLNGNNRVVENVVVENTTSTYAFLTYANADSGSGITNNTNYINCEARNCQQFGWYTNGQGTGDRNENMTYDRCRTISCGDNCTYEANEWSSGFCLSEAGSNVVKNVLVSSCYSYDSWEVGFYTELNGLATNVELVNCIAENNGLRKKGCEGSSYFGVGFLLDNASITNCISKNNDKYGFLIQKESSLIGCKVIGNGETAIGIDCTGLVNGTVSGCHVEGCAEAIRGHGIYNISITNNVFRNCAGATYCFNFLDASSPYSSDVIFSNNIINNISADYVMRVRGYDFNIHDNILTDCIGSTTYGIYLERSHCKFNDNTLTRCSSVHLTADHLQVNDNTFIHSIGDAISTGSASGHHQINDNKFYFSGGKSINIYNSDDIQINDNQIYNNSDISIHLEEGCNDISVSGNHIDNSSGYAIYVHASGNGNIISLNFAYNGDTSGIVLVGCNASVIGNVIHDNVGDGLYIEGWNNIITSNRIYNNGDDGIEEKSGSCGNNIIGLNNCLGNTGDAIIITGTGTVNSTNLGTIV